MLNPSRHRSRGASLIELMVGMVVGLFVVAGAMSLTAGSITNSRQLLTETRLNQDLRAAADLVARDLRRSGYWGNAINGTIAVGAGSATVENPYRVASGTTADGLRYSFSRDVTEDNALGAAEQFGFRLSAGKLQFQTSSGVWQDVTDDRSVVVTAFTVTPTQTTLALGGQCLTVCAPGVANCPTVTVRNYAVSLSGRSVSDTTMTRTQSVDVRLRNDRIDGQCPA
jgi:type IV pilus assembly protein PilW